MLLLSCKKESTNKKGVLILKHIDKGTIDTISYEKDSIKYNSWKNFFPLKDGDTTVLEVSGNYKDFNYR